LGQPRTEGATHAPESVRTMTWPLVLIAPFAIALGWAGIPASFPGLGGLVPNWLEHFMEPYIEYQGFHVAHPEFNIVPLAVSLVVALGGLTVGLLVYGRGLAEGQIDPLRRWLGPVWVLFHRKYYVDELYGATVIPFTKGLANFLYWVDDLWVIDPIVDAVAAVGVWLSWLIDGFDRLVVDGTVNLMGWLADRTGRVLRNTQDGHVQVYLLVAVVTVTVWLLLKAMPMIFTLV
jgi:NADH-quinone oxidoreductase subunit L